LCVDVCPNEAIHPGSIGHEIDPQRCTECVGFHADEQCAVVCPVDCCIPDEERVEPEIELFERACKLHPDRADELVLSPATSRFRR
jgi:ferredoxin